MLWYLFVVRKIPWIHVQTEDSHEKEPEVISTVGPNDNMSKVKLSEFPSPKELMEKELEARSRGTLPTHLPCVIQNIQYFNQWWRKY